MKKYFDAALKILYKIFSDNTYSNVALYDTAIDDMTTRLVYGVLEKNIELDYILGQIITKKPKLIIYILIKIGVYSLLYLDDVPDFAIVSECVEVCNILKKQELKGFVNAVLKKVAKNEFVIPDDNSIPSLSIRFSKPIWFVSKLVKQYGIDSTLSILNSKDLYLEHIRVNSLKTNNGEIEKYFIDNKVVYLKSDINGFYVKVDKYIKDLFKNGLITYQAPSSMACVNMLANEKADNILDLCAAPGGKSIYLHEINKTALITACDLYPHRVELINKYIDRMGSDNINPIVFDATKYNDNFKDKFDIVLLDAPCSCFGTFNKHPDVFLNKNEKDIIDISNLQKEIILNAAKYVKVHGVLLYSTCTLFKEENRDVVDYLIENYPNFIIEKESHILPHDAYDGFYVCKLIKND